MLNRKRKDAMTPLEVRQKAFELERSNPGLSISAAFVQGWMFAQAETAEISDADFDMFWALYDKKRGKDKAQKLWSKLSKKDKQDALAYIPLYKQAQPDKQYRKDPETFLRNKSWKDELIFNRNGDNDRLHNYQKTIFGYSAD